MFPRRAHLREHMDDPDCSVRQLFRTYRQFVTINRLFARWPAVYRRFIRPVLERSPGPCSMLDIGFGGGDVPLAIRKWADLDGHALHVTCVDSDPKSLEYARGRSWPENFEFLRATSAELVSAGKKYDIVISNHLVHHLPDEEILSLAEDADQLASGTVLFSDIERSLTAWFFFGMLTAPFFRDSFVVADGLTSIRRSFREPEIRRLLPEGWQVFRLFPYRLVMVLSK